MNRECNNYTCSLWLNRIHFDISVVNSDNVLSQWQSYSMTFKGTGITSPVNGSNTREISFAGIYPFVCNTYGYGWLLFLYLNINCFLTGIFGAICNYIPEQASFNKVLIPLIVSCWLDRISSSIVRLSCVPFMRFFTEKADSSTSSYTPISSHSVDDHWNWFATSLINRR